MNTNGMWVAQSFTTTEDTSDSFASWEHRNYNKLEKGANYAVYPVVRYEDADMLFAELNAAVAKLADLSEDEQPYQLARIRAITSRFDRALDKVAFNRKVEAANVAA